MNKFNNKQKIVLIFMSLILIGVALYYFYILKDNSIAEYEEDGRNVLIPYEEENTVVSEESETKNKILVDISGQVNKPGVVELEEGMRIKDAIEKAGGTTKNADTTDINLAYKLEDGMKIKIPSKDEIKNQTNQNDYVSTDAGDGIKTSNSNNSTNSKTTTSIININTATQKELETLPGIGESTAQKIIKYREEKGNFKKKEDIKNVSGIGDAKYEKIKDYIKV